MEIEGRAGKRIAAVALLAWVGVTVSSGCSEDEIGRGIGHRALPRRDTPNPRSSPLRIAQISPTGVSPFVVISNSASESIALNGFCLASATGWQRIPNTDLAADGGSTQISTGTSPHLLLPNAGEVAIIERGAAAAQDDLCANVILEADDFIHDYVAWGGPPVLLGSSIGARAVEAGLYGASEFVPLPFPMPDGTAVVQSGDGHVCEPPASEPGACSRAPSRPLRIEEFAIAVEPEDRSWVEIVNVAATPLHLNGVRLCQPPVCSVVGPNVEISANSRLVIHLGPQSDDDTEAGAGAGVGDVARIQLAIPLLANGEVALVAPGNVEISSADAILSYVRHGNAASSALLELAGTAVGWPTAGAGATAAPTVRISGEAMSLNAGADATDPNSWVATGLPTPGSANPKIAEDGDAPWSSCSSPATWLLPAESSPWVMSRVNRNISVVEIRNRAAEGSLTPVTSVILGLGDAELDLSSMDSPNEDPPISVAEKLSQPGAELTIEVVPSDGTCAKDDALCWRDDNAAIAESGSAALRVNAVVVDYILWGTADEESPHFADAAAAGRWPSIAEATQQPGWGSDKKACAVAALDELDHTELRLQSGAEGMSPADYD